MKKKNWIQFLKKTLIMFVIVVFSVFSTGFLVSIHECCQLHKHEVCEIHQPNEASHKDCSSETDHESGCCASEPTELDGCVCDTHDHCLIMTILIKITDNFVASDFLKNQLKSPTPILLFTSILNDQLDLMVPKNEPKDPVFTPPTLKLVGSNFINFTSQRVYYA